MTIDVSNLSRQVILQAVKFGYDEYDKRDGKHNALVQDFAKVAFKDITDKGFEALLKSQSMYFRRAVYRFFHSDQSSRIHYDNTMKVELFMRLVGQIPGAENPKVAKKSKGGVDIPFLRDGMPSFGKLLNNLSQQITQLDSKANVTFWTRSCIGRLMHSKALERFILQPQPKNIQGSKWISLMIELADVNGALSDGKYWKKEFGRVRIPDVHAKVSQDLRFEMLQALAAFFDGYEFADGNEKKKFFTELKMSAQDIIEKQTDDSCVAEWITKIENLDRSIELSGFWDSKYGAVQYPTVDVQSNLSAEDRRSRVLAIREYFKHKMNEDPSYSLLHSRFSKGTESLMKKARELQEQSPGPSIFATILDSAQYRIKNHPLWKSEFGSVRIPDIHAKVSQDLRFEMLQALAAFFEGYEFADGNEKKKFFTELKMSARDIIEKQTDDSGAAKWITKIENLDRSIELSGSWKSEYGAVQYPDFDVQPNLSIEDRRSRILAIRDYLEHKKNEDPSYRRLHIKFSSGAESLMKTALELQGQSRNIFATILDSTRNRIKKHPSWKSEFGAVRFPYDNKKVASGQRLEMIKALADFFTNDYTFSNGDEKEKFFNELKTKAVAVFKKEIDHSRAGQWITEISNLDGSIEKNEAWKLEFGAVQFPDIDVHPNLSVEDRRLRLQAIEKCLKSDALASIRLLYPEFQKSADVLLNAAKNADEKLKLSAAFDSIVKKAKPLIEEKGFWKPAFGAVHFPEYNAQADVTELFQQYVQMEFLHSFFSNEFVFEDDKAKQHFFEEFNSRRRPIADLLIEKGPTEKNPDPTNVVGRIDALERSMEKSNLKVGHFVKKLIEICNDYQFVQSSHYNGIDSRLSQIASKLAASNIPEQYFGDFYGLLYNERLNSILEPINRQVIPASFKGVSVVDTVQLLNSLDNSQLVASVLRPFMELGHILKEKGCRESDLNEVESVIRHLKEKLNEIDPKIVGHLENELKIKTARKANVVYDTVELGIHHAAPYIAPYTRELCIVGETLILCGTGGPVRTMVSVVLNLVAVVGIGWVAGCVDKLNCKKNIPVTVLNNLFKGIGPYGAPYVTRLFV